jgi:putative spermidine/putrescine transport system permease protein
MIQDTAAPLDVVRETPRSRSQAGFAPALLSIFTVAVCIFLVAPIVVVLLSSLTAVDYVSFPPVGLSLRWYVEVLGSDEFTSSLLTSVQIATVVAVVATVIGTLAALAIVRLRFPGRDALNALFASPLVIPGIVLGAGILQLYARAGIASSLFSLVLGHLVIAVPYSIRLSCTSLMGFDQRLELAAQNLGATPLKSFLLVTLPIVFPGIAGGAAFAFIVSFEDVNLALFLSSAQTVTLPVRIFAYMSQESSPIISAAGSLLTIIVVVIAVVIDRLVGLRMAFGK